ncbi:hypothetical protein [Amycolatopsis alkalitolerans]|uniref:Secreted protein n=1 Tax=Amycolatopsis alkalitolerans TaxID=2547244 RepID=A0A5C4LSZ8_9PSEU|nr:hypothetical protein [Amycolatopsis alkalitolerans]TNC21799.1 hypothetical protein FG385_27140 [Amycolatopsis alkalitolerans]
MRTATTIAGYGLALAVVVGGAWTAGAAIGPVETGTPPAAGHEMDAPAPAHDMGTMAAPASDVPPGLAAARDGYRLHVVDTVLPTGTPVPLRFHVLGPDEKPVTAFDVAHEKELHLILVRRDGVHYQHLHPVLAADGTWSLDVALPAAGTYRLIADFTPRGGTATTLGTDIQAAGEFRPALPPPSRVSTVDGYQVTMGGTLVPGADSPVTVTVTRDGTPVTDLQPYLGAFGHLVSLREADLAYLHVHPLGTPSDGRTATGPGVGFSVDVSTQGRYRLFFDFRHEGKVRTAEFTVDTTGDAAPAAPQDAAPHGHGG